MLWYGLSHNQCEQERSKNVHTRHVVTATFAPRNEELLLALSFWLLIPMDLLFCEVFEKKLSTPHRTSSITKNAVSMSAITPCRLFWRTGRTSIDIRHCPGDFRDMCAVPSSHRTRMVILKVMDNASKIPAVMKRGCRKQEAEMWRTRLFLYLCYCQVSVHLESIKRIKNLITLTLVLITMRYEIEAFVTRCPMNSLIET